MNSYCAQHYLNSFSLSVHVTNFATKNYFDLILTFLFLAFVNVPHLVLIMFSCIPSLLIFPPVFPWIFLSVFFMKESETVYRPPALSTLCHFLTVLEA